MKATSHGQSFYLERERAGTKGKQNVLNDGVEWKGINNR